MGLFQNAALIIAFDTVDDFGGADHVHAARKVAYGVLTAILGFILLITVAERMHPRLPATTCRAAW